MLLASNFFKPCNLIAVRKIERSSQPGSKWKRLTLGEPRAQVGQAPTKAEALLTLIHLSDLHVCDAQSTTRLEFIDRMADPGHPMQPILHYIGTYRAQEFLTVQVLEAMVQSVNQIDRKSTRLNSSHVSESRMPSSA